MVSTDPDRRKAPATVGATGVVATVTVTASLEAPDSAAVTVATPPASEIDAGDRARVTTGSASSSASVRVSAAGAATPWPPVAVAETVTRLSGASTRFPFAVTVTWPALAVCPAAMVSVLAALRSKSAGTAPLAATAAAATVTVTPSLEGWERVAVTVATPPVSEIEACDSARVTTATGSSSAMVPAAVAVPRLAFTGALRARRTVSSGSWVASPVTVTSTLPAVSPGAKVSAPDASAR